jgi:CDP-diacylglycerol--glycerol-3-phosphate 3-phosphatidyltransferase
MISVYNIKPAFQRLLMPLLRGLRMLGFTPNGITLLSLLLSITVGVLFWFFPNGHMLWILALSLLIRMALNALDGMMARTYNLQSQGGEILNELGDVLADTGMFFPLILLPQIHPASILSFLFLSLINEFSGVLAKVVSGTRRYDGPMGKSDRALVIGLTCLLLFFFPDIRSALNYVFAGMCILLIVSTILRIKNALNGIDTSAR